MSHYKFHTDCQSSVLTYEQVKRLDFVMDQTVPIHGRGNFPTLYVKLKELIRLVKHKLQKEHSIEIRDVRLNGGGANYVLAPENSHYNDLDLVFGTDLSNEDQFDVIRDVVLDCLKEFYPREPAKDSTPARCCGSHQSSPSQSINGNSVRAHVDSDEDERNSEIWQTCDNREAAAIQNNNNKNGLAAVNRLNDIDVKKGQQQSDNTTVEEQTALDHHLSGCEQTPNNGAGLAAANMGNAKQQSLQMPLNNCAMKEAYVHKMVKVNDDDRWSLISLGVQQSEVGCGQINGGPMIGFAGLGHCAGEQYYLAPTRANNIENRYNCTQKQTVNLGGKQMVGEILMANNNIDVQQGEVANQHSYHQHQNHHHQQQHQQQQQQQQQHNHHHYQLQQQRPKQFPNSIELKFVDRMRRKFEFSVDSFQIILDSLIQFYDYAPKPSIASQRDLMSSHPSSTVINTRPMIMNKRRCSTDCCFASTDCMALSHRMESNFDGYNKVRVQRDSFSGTTNCHPRSGQCHHHRSSSPSPSPSPSSSSDKKFNTRSKTTVTNCVSSQANSQNYYQFQLDANSPSLTSEASSSGCSSSSSVVSSSSSSLSSCDEDHEDLYCDVDGQSSSASTSSLLSSSVYSSDGGVVRISLPTSTNGGETSIINSKYTKQTKSNEDDKISSKGPNSEVTASKKTMASEAVAVTDCLPAAEMIGGSCCAMVCCSDPTNNYGDMNEYDFETDDSTSCAVISENFYPTVIGRSEYGNFKEALYHLEKKLIATRSPEEIRGGGLLKYCNLLVKNYKPTNVYQIRTLERYMCSRFFIDFSDLNQQQAKLESYLVNHFSDDLMLKIDYLTILHNVVQRSTVCLMNHELRLTLEMIKDMAFKMNDQQQHQHQQQQRQGHQNQLRQQRAVAQLQSHNNSAQTDIGAASQHQNHQVQKQQHQPKQFFSNQEHPKPLLIQSGVYRVKLVNYSLAKPAATTTTK